MKAIIKRISNTGSYFSNKQQKKFAVGTVHKVDILYNNGTAILGGDLGLLWLKNEIELVEKVTIG